MVRAEAGDRAARRRELEESVRRLALDEGVLDDDELERLWEELQEVSMEPPPSDPKEKAEAQANMQSFLETLFYNLSLNRDGTSVCDAFM